MPVGLPAPIEGGRMRFHEKLADSLRTKGWSVSDLATATGLTYPTVRSYLAKSKKNRRLPSVANLVKIAKALGSDVREFLDCDEFVKGDGDDTSSKL